MNAPNDEDRDSQWRIVAAKTAWRKLIDGGAFKIETVAQRRARLADVKSSEITVDDTPKLLP